MRQVAEQYDIPAQYDDYRTMLADSDAEAVINLTPIQLHAETTRAALEAGKHVYSEKPVATTLDDAVRIRDEADRRGLTLVCAPSVLLFPQIRFAWDLVKTGRIGKVHAALGRGYGGVPPWSDYPSDPSPFFARGGGPLADMGVYPLHAITGILGPAKRVSAFAAQARDSFVVEEGPFAGKRIPIEVEDNWHLMLDFGDGRLASVTANNVAQDSRAPQMELFGLEGTVSVNLLDVSAPVETLVPDEGWTSHTISHERSAGPDHLLGVEHLVECLSSGARPSRASTTRSTSSRSCRPRPAPLLPAARSTWRPRSPDPRPGTDVRNGATLLSGRRPPAPIGSSPTGMRLTTASSTMSIATTSLRLVTVT